MNRRRSFLATIAFILSSTGLPPTDAVAFTMTLGPVPGTQVTVACCQSPLPDETHWSPRELPEQFTTTVGDGRHHSLSTYDLSNDRLAIDVQHALPMGEHGSTRSYGSIFFSVDEDVLYDAAGAYSAINAAGRQIELQAWLADVTEDPVGATVFVSVQESRSSSNVDLVLGASQGDHDNVRIGDLAGTLTSGRRYRFSYFTRLSSQPPFDGFDGDASASGFVSLDLSEIPEPSTATLIGVGLVALGLRRRVILLKL